MSARSLRSPRCSSKSSFWRFSSVAAFGLIATTASPAHAIERQHHIGLAPALAILKVQNKSTASVGAGGALHYAYGITDQFNGTVEASSAIVAADQQQDFPTSPKNRPATIDQLSVGIGYVIDILQWVPHLSVQGGVFRVAGGTMERALILPTLSIGLGVDYQLSRRFAVGIGARQHMMVSKLSTYPSYTTALLRFEVMWGY